MKFFTIGYGGRPPGQFLDILTAAGVRTLVDVRLRPDRASLGYYTRAKDPAKGIEALLATKGIAYVSLVELGNLFVDQPAWQPLYAELMEKSGDLLTRRLLEVERPFCLMCAERKVAECHRRVIADYLERLGHDAIHLDSPGGAVHGLSQADLR